MIARLLLSRFGFAPMESVVGNVCYPQPSGRPQLIPRYLEGFDTCQGGGASSTNMDGSNVTARLIAGG